RRVAGLRSGLAAASARSVAAFGDIDGDGDLDVLVGEADGTLDFFENTGSSTQPGFAPPVVDPFGLGGFSPYVLDFGFPSPAVVDLDGDGLLDAFVTAYYGSTYAPYADHYWFANTGTTSTPAFASPAIDPFGIQPGGGTP